MSLKKVMKGLSCDKLTADGLLYQDWTALTDCQRDCTMRLGTTVQIEQEAYLRNHPEVLALLKKFVGGMALTRKRHILKEAGKFFTRPIQELDKEVREILKLPSDVPYNSINCDEFKPKDNLHRDVANIIKKHYPPPLRILPTPVLPTPDTLSSSFISIITSDTTLPTPESIPTPEPTLSETVFALISNTIDKAIFLHFDDIALRYDTTYVELMKAVEAAMEVPVVEIREDIANLFYNAYKNFEEIIVEKERIATEIAWERRIRKKMKRTLRREENFKGHETPLTPKSETSFHESYKKPPQKPCKCHPQFHFNRYPKDRFGIYLPREIKYSTGNTTVSPELSTEHLEEVQENDNKPEVKSIFRKKSITSAKSDNKKTAIFSK